MPETLGGINLLAISAVGLLLFVSAGVLYLSAVEWRDRRRRYAHERAGSRTPARKGSR
ncbi:MAG: hypothetical protein ACOVNL_08390 [Prochlorococcaceae cyanobacterium]